MDQPEELDSENVEAPGFPVRTAFRVFLVLYLVTLPACTKNAGHFGPGFFPLIAAIFLVPVCAAVSFGDAAGEWVGLLQSDTRPRKWWPALLMSLIAMGYAGIIAMVLIEKLGG